MAVRVYSYVAKQDDFHIPISQAPTSPVYVK